MNVCSRAIALEQTFIDLSRAQKVLLWYRKKILILEQALELVIYFLYQSEPPKNADTLHITFIRSNKRKAKIYHLVSVVFMIPL